MTVPTVLLGELADVVSGGTPKRSEPSFFGGDIPWVKIGDMLQGTVTSTEESITKAGLTGSSAKLLPAGTLLLSIFATIGRAAVLGIDAATNQAIAGLMIRDSSSVDRNYLRRYVEFASEGLANQGRGVAQANINLSILRSHAVPVPSIEKQRRIAAVLDAAEALRAKRRQAIAKFNTLTQAIFIDMFGNECLELVPLADLAEFKYGTSDKAAPAGPATLRIPNVVGGEVSYKDIKRVPVSAEELSRLRLGDGDLLFVRSNGNPEYVGRCAVFSQRVADQVGFTEPVIYASYLIRARLRQDRIRSTFACAFLNGPLGRRALRRKCNTSAGQYNLNTRGLGSVLLPLPPWVSPRIVETSSMRRRYVNTTTEIRPGVQGRRRADRPGDAQTDR